MCRIRECWSFLSVSGRARLVFRACVRYQYKVVIHLRELKADLRLPLPPDKLFSMGEFRRLIEFHLVAA